MSAYLMFTRTRPLGKAPSSPQTEACLSALLITLSTVARYPRLNALVPRGQIKSAGLRMFSGSCSGRIRKLITHWRYADSLGADESACTK